VCLLIAVVALLVEFILMFVKHHFLSLLCVLFVLSVFLLNYFDRNYIKFLLIFIAVTIAFDIAWLVIHFQVRRRLRSNIGTQCPKLSGRRCADGFWRPCM
jgi:nucleoside permease NupC